MSENLRRSWLAWLMAAMLCFVPAARAQVWISEVLFNPPGGDLPNEYIELRGTPNLILPAGTYFLAVEGDAAGNPGSVQNVFDLGGRALGGNGFLLLLQNSNSYAFNSNCVALINTNESGFGSGAGSGTRHRGEGGQTDLENGSVTFLLVQSTNYPAPGTDFDANDDGTPDGAAWAGLTVLDSVTVLDNDGPGDIGYGKINFRRSGTPGNAATVVGGTIVPIGFNASYVARAGNTTNWTAAAWVASENLTGSAPNWGLDAGDTEPVAFSSLPLNHLGQPNFGAATPPGLAVIESGGSTAVVEGGGADSYALNLTVAPAGNVTVQISGGSHAQVSIDGGASFASSRNLILNSTAPATIWVRAVDDNVIDASPHVAPITHAIVATTDATRYPLSSLGPVVRLQVTENDFALLNELKVNAPGTEDAPFEFIELRGAPNALLTNVQLVVIEGENSLNPGRASMVVDLAGERLGSSGLLLLLADGHPYDVPVGTRVLLPPQFNAVNGTLANGSLCILLVGSATPIVEGADLDAGDNGTLEGWPEAATLLDSVAWSDGGANDVTYSPALLSEQPNTPDAATRLPGDDSPNTALAWLFGELQGTNGASLEYAATGGSANLGYGTVLTPGSANVTAPVVRGVSAFSSVIGDPTTPLLQFQVSDANTPAAQLTVRARSSNPLVVPDANLFLSGTSSNRALRIEPIGVGYSDILIEADDGASVGKWLLPYAASRDEVGHGRFHTGASDASTALALDAQWMLVGDDENQFLRVYSRSNSGPPSAQIDLNPFLDLNDYYEDGRPREIDIEGSTRVGNRLYWIGSHSHARDLDVRTNRARIFATDLSGSGTNISLQVLGHYDFLKSDLLQWDATNGHGRGSNYFGLVPSGDPGVDPKALDGSGFNIEGLAMAPGDTNTAFVCFRAPIVPATNRSKALLVPVTNFATLATGTFLVPGQARFGTPMELNLGGRGIRSIEGNSNGFLIVAGPPGLASGVPPSDFRLFTWSGFAANAPQERAAWLTNWIIEGIVELPPSPWTGDSRVQLISDNGISLYYDDGIQAKFLSEREFKKARTDWVTLGPVVTSRPVLQSIRRESGNCLLTWYSVAGLTYRVQSKGALEEANWVDVPGDVVAGDALASKSVGGAGGGQRFYRVIIP